MKNQIPFGDNRTGFYEYYINTHLLSLEYCIINKKPIWIWMKTKSQLGMTELCFIEYYKKHTCYPQNPIVWILFKPITLIDQIPLRLPLELQQ